jgi:cation diffusion facilitator CzcD-associated flavoprotein CzcO
VATTPDDLNFDPDAVKAKYAAEREKRMTAGRGVVHDLTLESDDPLKGYLADPFTPFVERNPIRDDCDVAIIGAGIGGTVTGAKLREAGVDDIRLIDKAGGIGGTWYWNRYPGVMCDVESYIYMPMLEEMGYVPTTRYAFGEEIRLHLDSIGEKYGLKDDALFHTGVVKSEWDEGEARWVLHTDRGDEIHARWLVIAPGILNLVKIPVIPGMEDFEGKAFHSGRWDWEYTGGRPDANKGNMTNLADKVVAVVGTGASAVQILPPLAESAKHVYVFQRTPSAIGVRDNRPTPEEFARSLEPGWQRARMENFTSVMLGMPVEHDLTDDGWTAHMAKVSNPAIEPEMSMEDIALAAEAFDFEVMELHRRRIEELVADPDVAESLKPYYRYLCKRPLFHDEYFDAFNRDNVTLVDCPGGVTQVTKHGVVANDQEYEVDCIVYATGFEAEVTPFPRRAGHPIIGRGGVPLAEKWKDGPRTYLGIFTRGYPNLFMMPAPGQQSTISVNFTHILSEGAEFIAGAIALLEERGVKIADATEDAEADWVQKIIDGYADRSAFMAACTPSRLNFEGDPSVANPLQGTYGGGYGDVLGWRDLLREWRARDDFAGLELDEPYGES